MIFGKPTIYFDVDDTLVLWDEGYGNPTLHPEGVELELYGSTYKLRPHWKHIELLKKFKKEGYLIVVWSAAGQDWVEEVVRKLDIAEFVDYKLSKPTYFVDDKRPEQFLHYQCRIYLPPEQDDSIIPIKEFNLEEEE
jgi:predicted phosphatase